MATGYNFPAFPAGTNPPTSTGAGNALGGDGGYVTTVVFQVVMSSTGTVNFEHTLDGTNWYPLAVKDMGSTSGTMYTQVTTSGIFQADVTGSQQARPNVAANGGTITILANKVIG